MQVVDEKQVKVKHYPSDNYRLNNEGTPVWICNENNCGYEIRDKNQKQLKYIKDHIKNMHLQNEEDEDNQTIEDAYLYPKNNQGDNSTILRYSGKPLDNTPWKHVHATPPDQQDVERKTKQSEAVVIDMRPIIEQRKKNKDTPINCPLCGRITASQARGPIPCISSHINQFHTLSHKPIAVLVDWEQSYYTSWRHNTGIKMPLPKQAKEELGLERPHKNRNQ